ncbi:MAG TPA: hypothetical protein VN039_08880 [Nitrospira sp.]|nr:hypothetical protein [Nitrospira sp.]
MTCTRCSGLMVADHLLDMQESYLPMWMPALRCLACGNIVDSLIHYHRAVRRTRRATRLAAQLAKRSTVRSNPAGGGVVGLSAVVSAGPSVKLKPATDQGLPVI